MFKHLNIQFGTVLDLNFSLYINVCPYALFPLLLFGIVCLNSWSYYYYYYNVIVYRVTGYYQVLCSTVYYMTGSVLNYIALYIGYVWFEA